MDAEVTQVVGATLFSSDLGLREGAVALANASGLAVHALADADPQLREAVRAFVHAHLVVVEMAAAASAGLGRKLNWAAQSAHEIEVAVAGELGTAGRFAPTGVPVAPAETSLPTGIEQGATAS
jgi:hypothetical protein